MTTVVPPGPTPPVTNPLAALDNDTLWNVQLDINLLCAKNKLPIRKDRQRSHCLLAQTLKVEADLRGQPSPGPPYDLADRQPGHHKPL